MLPKRGNVKVLNQLESGLNALLVGTSISLFLKKMFIHKQ